MANFISGGAKYPVVELNKVASRKTGEIEAQCKLNEGLDVLYNGEIVYVDAVNNEITKTFRESTYISQILVDTKMDILEWTTSNMKETMTMKLLEIDIYQEFTN